MRRCRIFLVTLVMVFLCACAKKDSGNPDITMTDTGMADTGMTVEENVTNPVGIPADAWVTSIVMAVNPRFRMYCDGDNRVVELEAMNQDAEGVISEIQVKGDLLQDAIKIITGKLIERELIDDTKTISISVEQTTQEMKPQLEQEIITGLVYAKDMCDYSGISPKYEYLLSDRDNAPQELTSDVEHHEEENGLCDACGGAGQFVCDRCQGNPVVCVTCNGTGNARCLKCDENGLITCDLCNGTGVGHGDPGCSHCGGTARCKNCGGEGKTYACGGAGTDLANVIVGWEYCFACNGDGRCSNCKHTYESCMRCANCEPGKMPCVSCGGSRETVCADCDGLGTVECNRCQGHSGETCEHCNGTGCATR